MNGRVPHRDSAIATATVAFMSPTTTYEESDLHNDLKISWIDRR